MAEQREKRMCEMATIRGQFEAGALTREQYIDAMRRVVQPIATFGHVHPKVAAVKLEVPEG